LLTVNDEAGILPLRSLLKHFQEPWTQIKSVRARKKGSVHEAGSARKAIANALKF